MTTQQNEITSMPEVTPLEQAVADILNKASSAAGEAADFLSAELPDVVHQFLVWGIVDSLFIAAGAAVLSYTSAVYYKKAKNSRDDFIQVFGGGIAFAMTVLSGILCFVNIKTALYITIAPKVYLIEQAANFLK